MGTKRLVSRNFIPGSAQAVVYSFRYSANISDAFG